jgi:group II intron reverse transcriptase/maturase
VNAKANNTIDKVRELQRKLYVSAKANDKRRFHALYDKVYRIDILLKAWKQVKANKGSAGIDSVYIDDIVDYGEMKFIREIQHELIEEKYRPRAVKRVYIPKKDGKKRPLGIPIIKDRVVQMATKIVIEPIFEADFKEHSYGFRPKRRAHQALEVIRNSCNKFGNWVLDADIVGYFDNINHDKLMMLVEMKVSDKRILKLIRKWLKVGVMEEGNIKINVTGTPQGGVISPLLSNIYLNYLDRIWNKTFKHLGTLVRYADDFVIISRTKREVEHAHKAVTKIFEKLELQLHPEKTKFVNTWKGAEGFDFLGFHHRRSLEENRKGERFYTMIQIPTKKAMKSMREKVNKVFESRATLKMKMYEIIRKLNRKIIGFRNYYRLKYAPRQLVKIDFHIMDKLIAWYNNKHQIRMKHTRSSKVRNIINMKLEKLAYY